MTAPATPATETPAQAPAPTAPAQAPETPATPQAPTGDNSAELYLQSLADGLIKEIPEEYQDIVPQGLTPQQTISFVRAAQAKGLFSTGQPQDGPGAATPTRQAAPDYTGMNAGQLLRAGLKQA